MLTMDFAKLARQVARHAQLLHVLNVFHSFDKTEEVVLPVLLTVQCAVLLDVRLACNGR